MKKILFAAILMIPTSMIATAQNKNLRDESAKINQGIRTGSLTKYEANRLNAQKRALRNEAIRYKNNDGYISSCERRDLKRDNARLNANIYYQKHDRQRR